jgi:hypothetical protein
MKERKTIPLTSPLKSSPLMRFFASHFWQATLIC